MALEKEVVKHLTDEEVFAMAMIEGEKAGFEVIEVRKLPHEADYYLRYVVGYKQSFEQYGTWIYNVQMGGLHHGHYFSHYKEITCTKEEARIQAMKDFYSR